MQQAGHAVAAGRLPEHRHDELVVVAGEVARLEGGSDFVLAGGHFVVARLHRYAQAVELAFHIGHEAEHAARNDAVVLVFEFLPLGRTRAEEGAACDEQVGPCGNEGAVDEEIFLFKAAVGHDGHGGIHAEQTQHAGGLLVQSLVGTQNGRLFVEGDARPGKEHRGDAQHHARGAFHEVGGAGHVPRGIAASLEGGAKPAGGEARTVGLALHEGAAAELGQRSALAVGIEEAVVLFRGKAGQRIEDMGVMVRAAFHGPGFHGVGHHVGHGGVEATAEVDGGAQGFVHGLGQVTPHGLVVEDVAAVIFRGIGVAFGRCGAAPRYVFRVMASRGDGKHGMTADGVGGTHANSFKKMMTGPENRAFRRWGCPRVSLWKPLPGRR